MEVKIVKTKDFYDTMCEWWDAHNFPRVSPSMLPEKTFVCYLKDTPIYSTCFYNTDSNLCWLGWQITNPKVKKEDKKGGLELLFSEIEKYARYVEYHIIFTTSNTSSVERALVNRKFTVGDTDVNHYIKIL